MRLRLDTKVSHLCNTGSLIYYGVIILGNCHQYIKCTLLLNIHTHVPCHPLPRVQFMFLVSGFIIDDDSLSIVEMQQHTSYTTNIVVFPGDAHVAAWRHDE